MITRGCEVVGIDLGTTYSALAYLDPQLVPCVVADTSGHAVIPSVVYFDGPTAIVGDTALELAKEDSARAVQFIKLQMGEDWRREVGGQVHTPESISAIILAHLAREAEPQIGPVRRAVITVPAWFTERRRLSTEQAGRIAGLDVIGTLNEPMAAALAYGLHRAGGDGGRERNVLVYDLGGGTFDVTLMRITPTELVELATRGNRKLGGKDWDEALMGLVLDDLERQRAGDPRAGRLVGDLRAAVAAGAEPPDLPLGVREALHDLRQECERAKRRLSQAAKTTVPIRGHGINHGAEITRAQFEAATDGLVQATRTTVETALGDANLSWDRLDRMVLVGGSTHMPMVRQMLERAGGRPPDRGINPVTAVALGAAIYAHQLTSGQGPRAVRLGGGGSGAPGTSTRPSVRFVTAHGIGIRTSPAGRQVNTVLIPRNSPVPAAAHQRFRTKKTKTGPATGIRVVVTQGDTPDPGLAEVVGTARITGIPPNEPPGQPVEITLAFDPQSRLRLRALYVNTGLELALDLDVPGGLREEQVKHYHDLLMSAGVIRPPSDDGWPEIDDDLLEPID